MDRPLIIDIIVGAQHEIVGVLTQIFRFDQRAADILMPMQPLRAIAFAGPIGEALEG